MVKPLGEARAFGGIEGKFLLLVVSEPEVEVEGGCVVRPAVQVGQRKLDRDPPGLLVYDRDSVTATAQCLRGVRDAGVWLKLLAILTARAHRKKGRTIRLQLFAQKQVAELGMGPCHSE